jgi:2,4-dienoyl-CoA reductase-like NADH-dependent reductase (Old Yellow Enzyme family)
MFRHQNFILSLLHLQKIPGFVASSKNGIAGPGQVHFFTDSLASAWRQTVTEVYRTPSKIVFQICHAGSKVPQQYRGDNPALSPSGIPSGSREMSQADINDVYQDFILCAKRVKAIGADGIQLHGAHGFLISEFLSPALNRRVDKYGQDRTRIVWKRFLHFSKNKRRGPCGSF